MIKASLDDSEDGKGKSKGKKKKAKAKAKTAAVKGVKGLDDYE